MSQHVYEYPHNYIIGPHVVFHVSQSYSKVSSSKSMSLRSPVWEYFEIVGEKKIRCKLCMSPATTTLCVCLHACMDPMHASLCVCVHNIIRYSIVTETTI